MAVEGPARSSDMPLGYGVVAVSSGTARVIHAAVPFDPDTVEAVVALPADGRWHTVGGLRVRCWPLACEEGEDRRVGVLVDGCGSRLEELGVLAGGLAHELNNVLGAVLGNLDLARLEVPIDHGAQRRLERMEGGLLRARGLLRQVLAYGGHVRTEARPADLHAVIRDVGRLLRVAVPRSSGLELEFDDQLPWVVVDQGQIQQVALALVTNAVESFGDSPGTIVLRTGRAVVGAGDEDLLTQGAGPGPYVTFAVEDDGSGVPHAQRLRLFQPFVSSKGPGRGLGLAAALGVVRGHGGAMRVTHRDRGTVVTVFLPMGPAAAASPAPAPRRARSGGRVLFVDDEVLLHDTVPAMLEALGYQVDAVFSGDEALHRVESDPGRYVLVLLDLVMPGRCGIEVREELRRRWPGLPVLVCSGYHERAAAAGSLEPFLAKPFQLATLREACDAALRPGPRGA